MRSVDGPLTIEDIDVDTPAPFEVRLRTAASGLCHSDLHTIAGHTGLDLPAVIGHEAAGVVEAVGSDVTGLSPGDHVVSCTSAYCGTCEPCLAGHLHLCTNKAVTERRGDETPRLRTSDGERLTQHATLSTFSTAMLVHERAVVKIDPEVPLDRAALLGCAVVTGTGAALNTAEVSPGSSVAVFGVGGVGVSIIQGCRIAGARQIIAVDIHEHKLEAARRFGATHTIDGTSDNVVKQIKVLSAGGVDFSFDAVGNKTLAEQSLYALAPRGLATLVGAVHPATTKLELTVGHFFVEKRIQGCYMGSNRFHRDLPRYVELYQQGRLNLDDMVSRRISLDEVNDGFEAMKAGDPIRSVIVFDRTG